MSELKDRLGEITVNERVAKDIYKMEVVFDDLPENIKGAQFAHVKLNDKSHLLRRPFCICDFDRQKNSVTMCYAIVGEGTKILLNIRREIKLRFYYRSATVSRPISRTKNNYFSRRRYGQRGIACDTHYVS